MDLKETARQIHENAKAKGFWDKEPNTGEKLMLIVSEVAEAMEADREGNYYDQGSNDDHDIRHSEYNNEEWEVWFKKYVKNKFEDELADAMIRIMDFAAYKGIDLEWHIKAKMRYNSMRPHMHGKKY